MPALIDDRPRRQHERDRRPASQPAAEARNSDAPNPAFDTPPAPAHAGYDADLNPIDDEEINSLGSER